jgi:hypothetical protein
MGTFRDRGGEWASVERENGSLDASELARREQANLERIENRLNPEAGA